MCAEVDCSGVRGAGRSAAQGGSALGRRSGVQEWGAGVARVAKRKGMGSSAVLGAAAGAFLNAFLPMKRLTFFLCGPRKQRWRGAPQSC